MAGRNNAITKYVVMSGRHNEIFRLFVMSSWRGDTTKRRNISLWRGAITTKRNISLWRGEITKYFVVARRHNDTTKRLAISSFRYGAPPQRNNEMAEISHHSFDTRGTLFLMVGMVKRDSYNRNVFIIFSLHTEMDVNRCTNGIIRVEMDATFQLIRKSDTHQIKLYKGLLMGKKWLDFLYEIHSLITSLTIYGIEPPPPGTFI